MKRRSSIEGSGQIGPTGPTGPTGPAKRWLGSLSALAVFSAATVIGATAIGIPLGRGAQAQNAPAAATPGGAAVNEALPHAHADQDSSQLTAEEEAALLARAERDGIGIRPDVVAARNNRAAQAAIVAPSATAGSWEGPFDWPVLGVHASLLPNGKVLAYDSVNDLRTEASTEHRFTRAMLFDPVAKTTQRVDELLGFNIFCSGLAKLASGVVFTAGGNLNQALDGINKSTTFDPSTNTWTEGPAMAVARWYPSVTPLANGEMLVTGGGPSLAEVRQADGAFRSLSTAQQAIWAKREYQWLISAPNGKAAYVGPDNQVGFLDTAGTGSYQAVAGRDGKNRDYGSFASYAPGKVLIAGGRNFDSTAVVVDLNSGSTTATGSMNHQRRQHNLTVLANGSVLATGGFENSSQGLVDVANNVYDAEVYDPSTGQWQVLAPQQRARQYHSTAMLLPDGRVLSAGGGMCGVCDQVGYFQRNAEIFTPPYLYAADGSLAPRPVISSVTPQLGYGFTYPLSTPSAARITKVAAVRMSSVTHSVDMEQRYVPLTFTAGSGSLAVTAPASANVAPPGWYLLFVIDDQGVPSVAASVQFGAYVGPQPTTTTTTTTRPPTTTTRPPTTTTRPPTTTTRPPTTTTTVVPPNNGVATVYDDSLRNGWVNWSWAVTNLAAAGGRAAAAIEFEPDGWRGLYLHTDALTTSASGFEFWANGRGGNQTIRFLVGRDGSAVIDRVLTVTGTGWQQYSVDFATPLAAGTSVDVYYQDWTGTDQAALLIDDVRLKTNTPPVTTTTQAPATTTTRPVGTTTTAPVTTTTRPPATTTTVTPTTTSSTSTTSTTSTTTSTTTTTTTPPTTTTTRPPTTTTTIAPPNGSTVRTLFADAFVDTDNWSWAPHNAASASPVKVGSRALLVTTTPWTSVVLHLRTTLAITAPTKLEFWIHGGPGGAQALDVQIFDNGALRATVPVSSLVGGTIAANGWSKATLDLSSLGITTGQVTDVHFSYGVGDPGSAYSLDDVRLTR